MQWVQGRTCASQREQPSYPASLPLPLPTPFLPAPCRVDKAINLQYAFLPLHKCQWLLQRSPLLSYLESLSFHQGIKEQTLQSCLVLTWTIWYVSISDRTSHNALNKYSKATTQNWSLQIQQWVQHSLENHFSRVKFTWCGQTSMSPTPLKANVKKKRKKNRVLYMGNKEMMWSHHIIFFLSQQ